MPMKRSMKEAQALAVSRKGTPNHFGTMPKYSMFAIKKPLGIEAMKRLSG